MKWKLLVGARQRKEKKNNRRRIGARIENNIYGCASRRLTEIATTFFVPTSLISSALNFGKKSKYFNFDEKHPSSHLFNFNFISFSFFFFALCLTSQVKSSSYSPHKTHKTGHKYKIAPFSAWCG
jgi:hypothetical protein